MKTNLNSFQTRSNIEIGGNVYFHHSLDLLQKKFSEKIKTLPYSLSILLENLLRFEDGKNVKKQDIEAVINWDPHAAPDYEIQFTPGRVLLQDFTGVPAIADLTAMRSELKRRGGDPNKINPLQPVDLIVDHSVQVDSFGDKNSLRINTDLEFKRNHERYQLLKWAQKKFKNFRVVPPSMGICHQVNLEHLASVVRAEQIKEDQWLFPDTVVGTDSHTPMINGLGVLGWGVGGIEAEAVMLGQTCTMLIPQVLGVHLEGSLAAGVTSTDLVLSITKILRKKGVVGKFVEYFGPGVPALSVADRATVSNMTPEYGATIGLFPVDSNTLNYLRMTGRKDEATRTEVYYKKQNLFYNPEQKRRYSEVLEIDLSSIEPSIAGPSRPQDRCNLSESRKSWRTFLAGQKGAQLVNESKLALDRWVEEGGGGVLPNNHAVEFNRMLQSISVPLSDTQEIKLSHGSILIAAITSCTNTSNPTLMFGAGIMARNALRHGLKVQPWIKTSFAPGSPVVSDYLKASGLLEELEKLKFNIVGYGCTTCIGNSGPLADPLVKAIEQDGLMGVSVLSGNRNFEARISPQISANYLMSPALVIAYALAGHIDVDLNHEPLGVDPEGKKVFLRDLWPDPAEVNSLVDRFVSHERFERIYREIWDGSEEWKKIEITDELIFPWDQNSTYIQEPPFPALKPMDQDFSMARVLFFAGDFITTDHISPAGSFSETSSAGSYLKSLGVNPSDFNSYGSRRGNHEVMWRGTFANVRVQNKLTPQKKGGWTRHLPSNREMRIFDAAEEYKKTNTPLIVIAGKEYGSGSSRDWAAKGVRLLGVRAVIAESFERIHRSNLIGMGIAPLEFMNNESAENLKISGEELISIQGLENAGPKEKVTVVFEGPDGVIKKVQMLLRLDTLNEVKYFHSGGILPFVLNSIY